MDPNSTKHRCHFAFCETNDSKCPPLCPIDEPRWSDDGNVAPNPTVFASMLCNKKIFVPIGIFILIHAHLTQISVYWLERRAIHSEYHELTPYRAILELSPAYAYLYMRTTFIIWVIMMVSISEAIASDPCAWQCQ